MYEYHKEKTAREEGADKDAAGELIKGESGESYNAQQKYFMQANIINFDILTMFDGTPLEDNLSLCRLNAKTGSHN